MTFTGTEQLTPLKDLLNSVITQAQARLQTGSAAGSPVAGASSSTAVVFPVAFASAPVVTATLVGSGSVANLIRVSVSGITTSGFTLNLWRDSGSTSSITANWVAVL